jgi:alkanesulfonate monooxygenase SsuD/methylene tetrahydromethanopterin reductase-like flavin-dependent oxidoreductase (luciferase family)
VKLRRGTPGLLPPPQRGVEASFAPHETAMLDHALACAIVGSAATVRAGLRAFVERTGADELMVTGQIFAHEARLRSFAILAEVRDA